MDKMRRIPTSELFFDVRNPRMVEFTEIDSITPEEKIIEILWEVMDVRELVLSIAASGFFEHEPLIVANENGRNIVIEGNRRLAAVKVILNPQLISTELPIVDSSIKDDLRELPVILARREDAWRYLGFKHVNGPAKWGSFAKAKYISQVHNEFKISLEQIARQIGDTHKTVQRLYRGLMVVEQAEREKVFARDDIKKSHFSFSHMYTGLQYKGISQFLDLKDENDDTREYVPKNKIGELGELTKWLYGSKKDDLEPVVQSQNPHLRQLDSILQNREALAALRSGEALEAAFELTTPVSNFFEQELLKAKRSLIKAKGVVTEGDDGSEGMLKIVGSIANIANDLFYEMERKRQPEAQQKRFPE